MNCGECFGGPKDGKVLESEQPRYVIMGVPAVPSSEFERHVYEWDGTRWVYRGVNYYPNGAA